MMHLQLSRGSAVAKNVGIKIWVTWIEVLEVPDEKIRTANKVSHRLKYSNKNGKMKGKINLR